MGALHAGHASLMQAARAETGFIVVSVFVNPTQFGPSEDFTRYPRTWEKDVALCSREGVNLIYAPEAARVYPAGFRTYVEVHDFQDVLCGASRPRHFRGVATVVLKLLNTVQPDTAYFGQKDAQQARILQQMVRDLDVPVRLRICPIVREPDGLAISSRNRYLDADQRRHAVILHRALERARERIDAGVRDAAQVRQLLTGLIEATPGAVLDYAAVVDFETLRPLGRLQGDVLLALAVKFGSTRLIDNTLIQLPAEAQLEAQQ
jgi:pantoate--beta-alanine ligase